VPASRGIARGKGFRQCRATETGAA
jgi:hypothetical protein